jgi:hypothetical protein
MTQVGLFRSLAGAAVLSLLFSGPASAVTVWSEVGDAGDLLPTAQGFVGPVQEITGHLSAAPETLDLVDMFGFYIGGAFSAVTVELDAFSIADPVLYLFDAGGRGVSMNDDAGGSTQAALGPLPSGFGVGWYYLAITFAGVEPLDGLGGSIFDSFGTLAVLSADPVASWGGAPLTPDFDIPGAYTIRVTGVPEPGTFVLMLAGLVALGFRTARFGRV